MKKTVLMLLLLCGARLSAQTIIQQFAAISAGSGDVSDMDLNQPTGDGSVLIAMPQQLSPGIKVLSVTDNAPDGGNTYKQVTAAGSSCAKQALQIWYCENCKSGVTELKFHLSGPVRASINAFLEVSNLAQTATLDGSGAQVSDGVATNKGSEVGPRIVTTTTDFVIGRYFAATKPTSVTPDLWTYKTTYVYGLNLPAGTYQPTLNGGKAGDNFCMSVAAFKIAAPVPAKAQN
jgi:hypothetical protein